MPGGNKNFDRYISSAFEMFYSAIVDEELLFNTTPSVLLRNLQFEASDKLKNLMEQRREALIDFLVSKGDIFGIPSKSEFISDNARQWRPVIKQLEQQSVASYDEQSEALGIFVKAVNDFKSGTRSFVPGQLLCGPPGTGKTHVLKTSVAYAVSQGLNCIFTTISGEKAIEFGGAHIHLLLPIPVEEKSKALSVSVLATQTINRLLRDPLKLAYLQRLELIAIEEIGLISAELYEVINIVLQHIKCNKSPWGGILVFASGDHKQLPPVNGLPIWSSPLLLTSFTVFKLSNYVRSALDPRLQNCIELLRKNTLTEFEIEEICSAIRDRCNFVSSWNEILGNNILRVFGKKVAEEEAVQSYQDNIRATLLQHEYFCSEAIDEISRDNGTTWSQPLPSLINSINRNVLEQSTIVIHIGEIMRATYNDSRKNFTQGQLCIVQGFNPNDGTVTVKFAPPGSRCVNNETVIGCPDVVLHKITTRPHTISRDLIARRTQFPLKHFVAATIHKIIGDTIPNLATQFLQIESKYRLWLKEQLLVVLSRVKTLDGLTFVGSIYDTLTSVRILAAKTTQWDEYIDEVMTKIAKPLGAGPVESIPRVVEQHTHIFNPFHRELPAQRAGYCYLLVSTKNTALKYVGETSNLRRRLNEHNSGHGAEFTRPLHRRPWALYAYITGFPGEYNSEENITARRQFEFEWQSAAKNNTHASVNEIAHIGALHMNYFFPDATMVVCGELTVARPE